MKTSKYLEELNTQSAADLKMQLVEAKKELFNLRFQNATNQLDNTSRIKEVGKIVGIDLLDHIIIGDGKYISLREKNLL